MISRTRIRSFIAGIVAIVVVLVFASFVTTSMGMEIPGLSNIADMLGFAADEGGSSSSGY